VRDAGSRNGTFTNDLRLASGESAWIQPMDRLKFGAVSACLCPPAVLRRVLRLTHPVS
jgi:pSer/pThr/pTyr-binding forkhead associated (FHA) protein